MKHHAWLQRLLSTSSIIASFALGCSSPTQPISTQDTSQLGTASEDGSKQACLTDGPTIDWPTVGDRATECDGVPPMTQSAAIADIKSATLFSVLNSSSEVDKYDFWKLPFCVRWMSCGARRSRILAVSISNEATVTNTPEFELVTDVSQIGPLPPAVGSPTISGKALFSSDGAKLCFRLTSAPVAPHFPKATFTVTTDDCLEPVRTISVESKLYKP